MSSVATQEAPASAEKKSGKKTSAKNKSESSSKSKKAALAVADEGVKKRGKSNRIGMTNAVIKRLAQRGGMARVHPSIYSHSEKVCERVMQRTLRLAVLFAMHDKLKTISSDHVLKALSKNGVKLFGYTDRHTPAAAPSSGGDKKKKQ